MASHRKIESHQPNDTHEYQYLIRFVSIGIILFLLFMFLIRRTLPTSLSNAEQRLAEVFMTGSRNPASGRGGQKDADFMDGQQWETHRKRYALTTQDDIEAVTVTFSAPRSWSVEENQNGKSDGFNVDACDPLLIRSQDVHARIRIVPICTDWNMENLPIPDDAVRISFQDNVGVTKHRTYTIRYYDTAMQEYIYEEVAVRAGAPLDFRNDFRIGAVLLNHMPYRNIVFPVRILLDYAGSDPDIIRISDSIVSSVTLE